LTGKQAQLNASAFWYQKWTQQFPGDVNRVKGIDTIEGTAEFVGRFGSLLAFAGCHATNEYLLEIEKKTFGNPAMGLDTLNIDDEPYRLGFVAGMLLLQRNVPNWQAQVEQGRDMKNILLDGVAPTPQQEDEQLAQKIQTAYEKMNSTNGVRIELFISELKSENFYVLGLPKRLLVGAYAANSFVNSTINNTPIFIAKSFTGSFKGESGSVEVTGQDVGFLGLTGFTGGAVESGDYVFVPLPKEKLTRELDGSYSIMKDEHIHGLNLQLNRVTVAGYQELLVLR
jgi:hypothetical protein